VPLFAENLNEAALNAHKVMRYFFLIILSALLRSGFSAQTNSVDFNDLGLCITVPVTIGGKELRFVIDTGSTTTVFDDVITRRLPQIGSAAVEAGGAEKSDVKFFVGTRLVIGSISYRPEIVVGANLAALARNYGELTYGILGLDVLTNWSLDFDFEKESLRFLQKTDPPPTDRDFVTIPLRAEPGKEPTVAANVGGIPIELLIDYGNNYSIGLSPQDWDKVFPSGNIGFKSKTKNFEGVETESTVARVKRLDISKYSYTNLLACRLATTNFHSRLGLPFFRRHHTILNYPEKIVKLRRTDYKTEDERGMSGVRTLWSFERKLFVNEVESGSKAAEAGLKPGDEIIAIDDKAVATLSQANVITLFQKGDGESLCLDVGRGDSKQRVCFLLKRKI
jgi:hypothetical protein